VGEAGNGAPAQPPEVSNSRVVDLSGRCQAAAAGRDRVWYAVANRVFALDQDCARIAEGHLEETVNELAVGDSQVLAFLASGQLAWLDSNSGKAIAARPIGRIKLTSCDRSIWAVDYNAGQAWRVRAPGELDSPRRLPGATQVAADGDRLWWTTAEPARICDFERSVPLPADAAEPLALRVCAGSVWISVADGLCRVGAWAAEVGATIQTRTGPLRFLTCASGALVGATEEGTLFILDPSVDSDGRCLEPDAPDRVRALVALGETAWVFSAEKPQVRILPLRG
jgi:hypothetical protein